MSTAKGNELGNPCGVYHGKNLGWIAISVHGPCSWSANHFCAVNCHPYCYPVSLKEFTLWLLFKYFDFWYPREVISATALLLSHWLQALLLVLQIADVASWLGFQFSCKSSMSLSWVEETLLMVLGVGAYCAFGFEQEHYFFFWASETKYVVFCVYCCHSGYFVFSCQYKYTSFSVFLIYSSLCNTRKTVWTCSLWLENLKIVTVF